MPSTSKVSALDPRTSLATAVHSQPGVYALLLGSGTSTGAGVPTGWGVVRELISRAAAASGSPLEAVGDGDVEEWWAEYGDGQPLGYSSLLSGLASTAAGRRALLAGFFEPSEEDREQGVKVPGKAHRAIATLVRRGHVRVIVTTTFDRLIEQALEAEGVFPQIIATPSAIKGMEPLPHAKCTLIKLHGDYARIDQLNTVEELSSYDPALQDLLDRVLDEYGLVVNGWSGDWDHALVTAIEATRSRRYPLYWASFGGLGSAANRLVAQHRAQVIEGVSADQFFPDLVDRIEALDSLADPPLTRALAVARLKRLLLDPSKYIELHDLMEREIVRIREHLSLRTQTPPNFEGQTWEDAHSDIRDCSDTLLHLVAHGVYFDRDRQHTDLWIWLIEQLMRARPTVTGQYNQAWTELNHYPAALVLRSASIAAVATRHEDVFLRLQREPKWRSPYSSRGETSALNVLHDWAVLEHDVINAFPRWNQANWLWPRSHLLKDELRNVFSPLLGDEDSYIRAFHRTEYRIALAQALAGENGSFRAAPGEFIGDGQWTPDGLLWAIDFREHADREAWGWKPTTPPDSDPFADTMSQLTENLKSQQRWG